MSNSRFYDQTSDVQPVPVRMRPGLRFQEMTYQSESQWVVKDPYEQQYYQFNEHEFAILRWLDGRVSFHELREKFEREFSPYRVNYRELTTLIREFFKKSVVVSTYGHNGAELHDYSREKRAKKLQKKVKSILAIQWRGWDPTDFLDATYPLVSWFFSRTMVRLNLLFVLTAVAWLLYHYDEFLTRLPGIWTLLNASNWGALALAICTTKMLHELGHAYAHRRFGGECHEIGVMIFFFVPTLYCDTSDSWMLNDKWKRMAIGAAGVYVEAVIFSAATFVWWFSSAGSLQDIGLNLMAICSISAVLTNGNPLMRYDGYFVLADWLEIPNLSEQSSKEIRRQFLNRCLGIEHEVDHWSSSFNKRVSLWYGLASFVFKVFLITTISYFIITRFQSVGLASFGLLISIVSLSSLFIQPVKSMSGYFKQPGNWQHVRKKSLLVTCGVAFILLAIAVLVPLPFYVKAECTVELADQQTLYAPAPARIERVLVRPGESVARGQLIAELDSDELREQGIEIESQLAEVDLQLKYQSTPVLNGQPQSSSSEKSFDAISRRRTKLLAEQTALNSQLDGLEIRAPQDGFIYGLTIGQRHADTDDDNLNQLYGNPLHPSNLGGWLERGDPICRIGGQAQQEITLLVEQKRNGFLKVGQEVSVMLASLSERLSGQIAAVSLRENQADELPSSIYQQSTSPTVTMVKQAANADKRSDLEFRDGQTFTSTVLQATVTLDDEQSHPLNFASIGKARILVGHRTLFWRVRHAIGELFQRSL